DSLIADEAARVASDVPPPPSIVHVDVARTVAPTPLDKTLTPWDARIHASTQGVNADGTYKRRKGVSVEDFARIAAELRSALPNATLPAPMASDTPAAIPVADDG